MVVTVHEQEASLFWLLSNKAKEEILQDSVKAEGNKWLKAACSKALQWMQMLFH